jgi:hypothetical protein
VFAGGCIAYGGGGGYLKGGYLWLKCLWQKKFSRTSQTGTLTYAKPCPSIIERQGNMLRSSLEDSDVMLCKL